MARLQKVEQVAMVPLSAPEVAQQDDSLAFADGVAAMARATTCPITLTGVPSPRNPGLYGHRKFVDELMLD